MMVWLLCISGVIFCLAGTYHFRQNMLEEKKNVFAPTIVMLMGVILIAFGTAKYLDLL